jgi:hypothetical protein
VPLCPVAAGHIGEVVVWLTEHWRGEPFIPDELRPLVAAA